VQLRGSFADGFAAGAELFDALLGERDNWMTVVVVLSNESRVYERQRA
jgi:hypothetical protein